MSNPQIDYDKIPEIVAGMLYSVLSELGICTIVLRKDGSLAFCGTELTRDIPLEKIASLLLKQEWEEKDIEWALQNIDKGRTTYESTTVSDEG